MHILREVWITLLVLLVMVTGLLYSIYTWLARQVDDDTLWYRLLSRTVVILAWVWQVVLVGALVSYAVALVYFLTNI